MVKDLALSNDFRYFVTLTLDKQYVDRYDVGSVVKRLSTWCDNRVRRQGLKYVLVPELHKDGALHFHGLINDVLPVSDSGTLDRGSGKPVRPRSSRQRELWLAEGAHIVYNLPSWSLGFSTAIELYGDRTAAVGYVCKYIGKGLSAGEGKPQRIGHRWYFSGGQLDRPFVECYDVDIDALRALPDAHTFVSDSLGCELVAVTLERGEVEKIVRQEL